TASPLTVTWFTPTFSGKMVEPKFMSVD
ncbi:hypothetical protein D046_2475B, partial [Vibrio parahaemolyticus V-223/04]